MATLDWITTNPATEAFQRADRNARENDVTEQRMLSSIREENEKKTTWPTRLRKMEADTSVSETHAETAKAEAPFAGPRAAAGLRQANAGAFNTEMQSFYKSIELLDAGDIEGAREIARRAGQTIPDAVINDADTRGALSRAAKRAKELYPDRPKDQQQYVTGFITDANTRRSSGGRASDPTASAALPTGAPEPQEEGKTFRDRWQALPATQRNADGKDEAGYIKFNQTDGSTEFISGTTIQPRAGAGGARGPGKKSVFEQKQDAWLAVHPNDSQGALDYASGRRQLSEPEIAKSALSMARSELTANTMMKFKPPGEQTKWVQERAQEIANQLRTGFANPQQRSALPQSPTTVAVVAEPPTNPNIPPRPEMMTGGDGGKPLNVALPVTPAGVPPGSSYSPSRKMWRSPDGRVFDENGIAVSQ